MAWISDGKGCRIQFATYDEIDDAMLQYWPEDDDKDLTTTIVKRGWAFVDGGKAHHTMHLHNLESKLLKKDTLYMYQVGSVKGSATLWSDVYKFHTPSSGDTFEFVATGDMGTSNAVSMPNLLRVANQHRYDFIAFAGDQAYDMADFNGTKGDEYMNFVQDIYATIPVMAAPGNHENTYNFSHYKNRFSINPYAESGFDDPTMYSLDYKSLHLVSFSSEVFFDEGSPEQIQTALQWLDQDLAKANANRHIRPWIMVFAHRPLYCSPSESEDCTDKADIMRNGLKETDFGGLEALFLKHRVDIYICGHRHNYERTYPLAHNKRMATSYYQPPSFFQLIVGNAGNFQGTDSFENASVPIADWSALRYEGYGFSTIKVSPTKLQISHHQSLPKDGALGRMVDRVIVRKPRYTNGRRLRCSSNAAASTNYAFDNEEDETTAAYSSGRSSISCSMHHHRHQIIP
ncbi:Metallo-dependent phosphatase-like protein [Zychaea mexicana]|uniref:Metallo-dependent phosphatase-like protein n=1 Tax=Zychaea mexicana TaxID=64656 RepID=UPI0022FEA994|nr:Metallo-dependent phosphatase-like protein [Zychaea mexicana]KAI9498970.1 Metallo-dependent phosphatase-like protein [Zychaea mexicana]